MPSPSRRRLLKVAGLGLAVATTGCSQLGSAPDDDDTATTEADDAGRGERGDRLVDDPDHVGDGDDPIYIATELEHFSARSLIRIDSIDDGCAAVEWSFSAVWVMISTGAEPTQRAVNLAGHEVAASIVREGDTVRMEHDDGSECRIALGPGEVERYEAIDEIEADEESPCDLIGSGYSVLLAEDDMFIAEAGGSRELYQPEWCHEDVVVVDGRVYEVLVGEEAVQLVETSLDRLVSR